MTLFNYTTKEIILKVVYYGPGFSGKTTNLQHLHSILPSGSRGKLISLATEGDRTLFFDFLPVDFGKIKDFHIKFQLYTVPGQVKYNATRRLVLKGADGVVFVADSQKVMREQNIESFNNMIENFNVNGLEPDNTPVIFQYNKRDIGNIMSVDELNSYLNNHNASFFEAVAVEGKGVQETFKGVTNILLRHIADKHKIDVETPEETAAHVPEVSIPEPIPSEKRESGITSSPESQQYEKPVPTMLDLSRLIETIGELRDVMLRINNNLTEMNDKQTKIINELFEFRQVFLKTDKKKGLKKFFR